MSLAAGPPGLCSGAAPQQSRSSAAWSQGVFGQPPVSRGGHGCFQGVLEVPATGGGSVGQERGAECSWGPKTPHSSLPQQWVHTHRGSRSAHPPAAGAPQRHRTALPSTSRTESRCPEDMWQGPASGPHERGPGTSPAGTQLLPAPNKGHLTAQTAGRLWVQRQGQGARHHAATLTSPSALLPTEQGQHRATAWPPEPALRQDGPRIRCLPPAQARLPSQLTSSRC